MQPQSPEQLLAHLEAQRDSAIAHFDPVQFHYLLGILKRAQTQSASIAKSLHDKAYAGWETLQADFSRFQQQTRHNTSEQDTAPPAVQGPLAQLTLQLSNGRAASSDHTASSLDRLLQQQEQETLQTFADKPHRQAAHAEAQNSVMQQLRLSLHKGRSEQKLIKSIQQAPLNPGPLNAEALIVRSLQAMQAISPAYTHRFVNYLDTLLWLQQQQQEKRKPKR